jgi:hypothetical protein
VGSNTSRRSHSRKTYPLLAAIMLLTVLGSVKGREVRADSQIQMERQPASSESFVIQGRVTAIQGAVVTVKTPDDYPGGPGVHAQFVIAGPAFRVDISRARVLLPDGKQADRLPLGVGDRVLMVLSGPDSESSAPGGTQKVSQIYFASIIERIAPSDKIITH